MAGPNKKSQPAADAPKVKGGAMQVAPPSAPEAKGAAAGKSASAGEGAETTASPSPSAQVAQEKVAGGMGLPGNAKAEAVAQASDQAECKPGLSQEIPGKYRKFKK